MKSVESVTNTGEVSTRSAHGRKPTAFAPKGVGALALDAATHWDHL